MWEPSRIHTRCETSSALERSAMSSLGMPRRWVTMRVMSTAALAMPSMAEMTCSTDAMPSASAGRRTARMHTARISWDEVVHALLELAQLGRHARDR